MRTLIALIAAATSAAAAPAVVAKIPLSVATAPCAAAAGGRFVWVSEYGSPYLVKINPKTNKVVGKTKIGFGSCGLGYGAGSMWIEDTSSSTISRVSVTTGQAPEGDPGRQHALRRHLRLRRRLDDVLRRWVSSSASTRPETASPAAGSWARRPASSARSARSGRPAATA